MHQWQRQLIEFSKYNKEQIQELEINTWNYFDDLHVHIGIDVKELYFEESLRENIPVSNPYWCSFILRENGIIFSSQASTKSEDKDMFIPYVSTEEEFFQMSLVLDMSEFNIQTIQRMKKVYDKFSVLWSNK